jgi:hypothetical protein
VLQANHREKDLVDLAFAGLSSYLKEKMEGQDFHGMNQVLQRALLPEHKEMQKRITRA